MSIGSLIDSRDRSGRAAIRRTAEAVASGLIHASGWAAILILAAIASFLLLNASRALGEVGLLTMLTGDSWYPTSDNEQFGFVPMMAGTAWVTIVALLTAVPLGVASAVYISEFATGRVKEISKSIIEFMAAIPSVVYGLLGIALLVPAVKDILGLDTGLTAFTAGVVVGIMVLPTIVSISEDALHAVPDALRQGSAALGNTRWQTVLKVVLPAASSGIFAATMLGMGRAIGETMVVLMLAGNAGIIPGDPFVSVRTMPGTIAAEMGEVVRGGLHYSILFATGLVLFAVTFAINLAADLVLERQRKRWGR